MINRKIPATMATQHPDHASTPFWKDIPFISTQDEAEETFISFADLGITEYKWDWEGKLVDESVLERLFGEHFDFFKKNPLGQERFLTFRLPNPKVQSEFRLGRAFMNLASSASVAKHFGLFYPPLFEVILPMTETPEEILDLQVAFQEMHALTHPLYRLEGLLSNLRIIPLFEQVSTIINSEKILEKYFAMYKKIFKKLPPYFRPYVARSDPALNSGIIPTVLAIKIALSDYKKLAKKMGFPIYPIIGAAALPFRGGISPLSVRQFADEYKGIRTTTIQSAFRYDYKKTDVKKAIAYLEKHLPTKEAMDIKEEEKQKLIKYVPLTENYYRETIEKIASTVNEIAMFMPKRRERVQHVGLFGYSRGVGKVTLPRAISFTGALYSLGVPPELIGTGRAIKKAKELGILQLLEKYYIYLKSDLDQSGRFLNKEVLENLAKTSLGWEEVKKDVEIIEEYLGKKLGPQTKEEKEHVALSKTLFNKLKKGESIEKEIIATAVLRKSLG